MDDKKLKPNLFQPGNPGRVPGSKNKAKQSLVEFLALFTEEKKDEIAEAFSQLTPKEKIQAWGMMISYILPRKQQLEIEPAREIPDEYQNLSFEQLCAI